MCKKLSNTSWQKKGYTLKNVDEKLDLVSIIEQAPPDLLIILVQLGQQMDAPDYPVDINNKFSSLAAPLEATQQSIDEEKA